VVRRLPVDAVVKLYETLELVGEFEIYTGYQLSLHQGHRTATPSQRWFWQVAWKVNKQENAKGA
jgi:hypothetical protein